MPDRSAAGGPTGPRTSRWGSLREVLTDPAEFAWAVTSRTNRWVASHVWNPGTSVWERDWDVLLILDACRRDLLMEVAEEYGFIGGREGVGSHWSVASTSADWMRRTFAGEYASAVERTAYVTGNPYSAETRLAAEPGVLDEVWRDAWDDDLGTVPARPLTDRAIATWRAGGVDRLIVHYMQPHFPSVPSPSDGGMHLDGFGEGVDGFWGPEMDLDDAWERYRENLRYVLDDVDLFLSSVDADTVAISADHGNATGTLGVWGHPDDLLLPSIRRVPWVETSASDTGDYAPELDRGRSDESEGNAAADDRETDGLGDDEVQERLRALGYTE